MDGCFLLKGLILVQNWNYTIYCHKMLFLYFLNACQANILKLSNPAVIDSQYLVVVEKEFQNESCEDVDPPSSSWCFHLSCHCWWRFICCFFVLVNLFFPLCHCLVLHFPTGFLWSELPGEFLLIFTFFSRSTSLLGSWSAGLSPFFRQSLKFVRWRGFVLCWRCCCVVFGSPRSQFMHSFWHCGNK